MESDLIYSLEIVAYDGNLLDSDSFSSAFQTGLDSVEFKDLIRWVTNEINILGNIDEKVIISQIYIEFINTNLKTKFFLDW